MHPQISITRRQLLAGCTVLAAQMGSDALWAQEVVKVLVGFPAGGAIDATARVYSNATSSLGTMIVENRAGAAGNIAAGTLAQSNAAIP